MFGARVVIDEEKALEELVGRGIRIPPQPDILVELSARLQDGDYDAASLAALISRDAAIAAMLFKVARSPLFSRGRAPDNLEQVLVRLGLKQTINLARAVALSARVPEGSKAILHRFWTRSREIAQLAALVAEDRVSVCNVFPDQAYMAGIFLECGVPVLMQRFPDYAAGLLSSGSFDLPSVKDEDQRFNVDHCTIGYLVARHWRLPDFVAQAILHHYDIPREELGAVRTVVAILQLAIHCHHGINGTENRVWYRVGVEALNELGLHPDGLSEFLDEIREAFHARGV